MPRVIGIDPGTVTVDLCGLDDGRVFADESWPTERATADPAAFAARVAAHAPVDLVAGPSGYGLPLVRAEALTDELLRLAFLAAPGDEGGIGGIRALARALAAAGLPVVFTPGVIPLPSVPPHRKVTRADLGTADKVCAAACAAADQAGRLGLAPDETSFILLELGGAFTAALAVEHGAVVDGVGGTAGPLGFRAAGALDGEVAFLADRVTKATLFGGGVRTVAGEPALEPERLATRETPALGLAWDAYVEGAHKAVAALLVSLPRPREIILSGRLATLAPLAAELARRLSGKAPVHALGGRAALAKAAAEGAAVIADGLAGGEHAALVRALRIAEASGTALDHLYVVPTTAARRRLGLS
ncbi:MAG TPA: DUF1464 family protein [Gemmatimonadaceae bacterium]|nr:DUF1464 family protein [Gemmatimonadaceae bacterium]